MLKNYTSILWYTATLCLAIIIHLFAILYIPQLAGNRLWQAIKNYSQPNKMLVLSKFTEGKDIWAFRAPDMYYALCRYNVSKRPVYIDMKLLRGHWSAALYTQRGRNFYAVDGYDLRRTEVSLVLLNDNQTNKDSSVLSVIVPEEEGLLVIRAPKENRHMATSILGALRDMRCRQQEEVQ